MMHIQNSINSDWLFNTQSIVLQADWFILEINVKATLNINMPYLSNKRYLYYNGSNHYFQKKTYIIDLFEWSKSKIQHNLRPRYANIDIDQKLLILFSLLMIVITGNVHISQLLLLHEV